MGFDNSNAENNILSVNELGLYAHGLKAYIHFICDVFNTQMS